MGHASSNGRTADIGKMQVAGVYAKALLAAARKTDSQQTVVDQIDQLVHRVIAAQPRLDGMLSSPRVSAAEKKGVLDRALKGRIDPAVLTFLKVLADHQRIDCLREIAHALRRQWNEQCGRIEAIVTTATPLALADQEQITQSLRNSLGQQVVLEHQVDPDLLGGIVVRVGDTVYDGSIRHRLAALRESILQQTTQQMRAARDRFATNLS